MHDNMHDIIVTCRFFIHYLVKTEFQIEALTLIHNLMVNRTRHARDPVQPSVPLHIINNLEIKAIILFHRFDTSNGNSRVKINNSKY